MLEEPHRELCYICVLKSSSVDTCAKFLRYVTSLGCIYIDVFLIIWMMAARLMEHIKSNPPPSMPLSQGAHHCRDYKGCRSYRGNTQIIMFPLETSALLPVGLCLWKARIPGFQLDWGLGTDTLSLESDYSATISALSIGHSQWHPEDLSDIWEMHMWCWYVRGKLEVLGLATSIMVREYSKKWILDFPRTKESGMLRNDSY